jgi:hypothetical protein
MRPQYPVMRRGMGRFAGSTGNPSMGLPPGSQQGSGPPPGSLAQDQYGITSTNQNRFFFTYQTPNIASLGLLATATNSILFDNDSVFEWTKMTVWAYDDSPHISEITNSSIIVPSVTLQIQDTGQGAYYSNAAIPLGAYAGAFGLPYVLPTPQFIAPQATLQFTFTSEEGTGGKTYYNLRVQLHGFKIKRA